MLEFGHPLPGPTVTDEGGGGVPPPYPRLERDSSYGHSVWGAEGGWRAYGEGYGGMRGAGVSRTLAKAAVGWEVGWAIPGSRPQPEGGTDYII